MLNTLTKNYFHMNDRITLLIPNKDNKNNLVCTEKLQDTIGLVAGTLSRVAGGASVRNGIQGYYYTEDGILCEEVTTEVEVYSTKEKLDEVLENALVLAEQVKSDLEQESVGLKVNDTFYFI